MKTTLCAVLAVAAVLSGLSFSQGPGSKDPTDRKIEVLEQDLISTRQKAEDTAKELAETKATLARVVRYLEAQSKAAAALATALDESEKAGFTFGINPESRHILLRGWREQLAGQQKDVPVVIEAKPAAAGAAPKK